MQHRATDQLGPPQSARPAGSYTTSRDIIRHCRIGPTTRTPDDPNFRALGHAFAGVGLRPLSPCYLTVAGRDVRWVRCGDRFGSGLGLGQGSWARGMLSQPMTYWEPANLRLYATGGLFTGGKVRLAAHWWELRLPR